MLHIYQDTATYQPKIVTFHMHPVFNTHGRYKPSDLCISVIFWDDKSDRAMRWWKKFDDTFMAETQYWCVNGRMMVRQT